MKKSLLFFLLTLLSLNFINAICTLDADFINQDPYPAVPGDYVKMVFQLRGIENSDCQTVSFELMGEYPISFDPGVESKITAKAGTYTKDFNSYLSIPYKVRIDADALDGDIPVEVKYGSSLSETTLSEQFNITIEDVRADFEVFVKNYDYATNIMTLEILNVGKNDVEAMTISMFGGKNVAVKGASTNVIGSLDSNDFTTADFEAIPSKGEIDLAITYTDATNTRRTLDKTISFDPDLFSGRKEDEKSNSSLYYIIGIIAVCGIAYYFYRKRKKEKKAKLRI